MQPSQLLFYRIFPCPNLRNKNGSTAHGKTYDGSGQFLNCLVVVGADAEKLLNRVGNLTRRKIVMPMPKVSKFELYNDGGFVCDIHAIYTDDNGIQHEACNHENFPIAQSRTMDLQAKCEGIFPGATAQLKVWIALGKDNTYAQVFQFDPHGPTQKFKISGATLNNSIQYLGPA
jgi:hypothetical protein